MTLLGLVAVLCFSAPLNAAPITFDAWREQFVQSAISQGIAPEVVEQALSNVTEDEEVIALDRKQPESKITLSEYLKNTVTPRRIRLGRELMAEHKASLEVIAKRYGVPPQYILALWGVETDYGNVKGNFSVVQSLATLAYEGRRRAFFSKELLGALRILQNESMPSVELAGSWAGAMGNCQFMPSTYLKYAADGDGDGKRDIWNSLPDSFASIANYLHALGWKPDISWGGAAVTPPRYSPAPSSIRRGKSAREWHKQGFAFKNPRTTLSNPAMTLYAVYPGSKEQGVFLVTENYKALLQWNRSRYFATAVSMLADAIGEEE